MLVKRLVRKRQQLVLVAAGVAFLLFFFLFLNSGENVEIKSNTIVTDGNSNSGSGTDTVPFYKTPAAQGKKQTQSGSSNIRQIALQMEEDRSGSRLVLAHDFFNRVFDSLLKGKPKVSKLVRYKSKDRIYHAGYDGPSDVIFSENYLNSFLDLTDNEVKSLKDSHTTVVKNLPQSYPKNLYKGNGIVYVGGGKFNWLALLSIKSLRSLDCKLPVEVLIPTEEEYEIELCTRVFPALNAKCILLSTALGAEAASKFSFKGYQYKALALIVSSFENVLLLDSDNIPVHAPDYLFESEPFISTGLITWPDFWRRATSPSYYKIANINVGTKRVRFGYDDKEKEEFEKLNRFDALEDIPYHDRNGAIPDSSSESGQLLISKSSHSRDLFLALYYNLYGPDYYYPLFSQGSDGEGDKETFIAAAVALNSKFYQVNKFLAAFGHFDTNNEFIGTGMGQFDPVYDYLKKDPKILFVHANFPKLNPVTLKKEGKIIDKNGNRLRLYGSGMAKRIGYDFELIQWKSMHFLVCDLKIEIDAFEGASNSEVCQEVKAQLKFLEDTVKDNERD